MRAQTTAHTKNDTSEKMASDGHELRDAADKGDLERLQCLLDRGVDVNAIDEEGNSALHNAAWCGDYDCVELLLERGADVKAVGYYGVTPLHLATTAYIVNALIARGADKNARDSAVSATPAHRMAFHDQPDALRALLKHKEVLILTDWNGDTPLDVARERGNTECVEILEEEEEEELDDEEEEEEEELEEDEAEE